MNQPVAPTSPPDFLLEWYKLHRQHELELNKATLAYELELAKLLVLLNGAAAGAFLTLTGAVWKDGPRPSFWWLVAAIVLWLAGLVAAAVATHRAYKIQREFTKAYRFRRHGIELKQIEGLPLDQRLLGIKKDQEQEANPFYWSGEADKARKTAEDLSKNIWTARWWAVGLFVLGAVSGLAAFFRPLTSAAPPACL
jgi:hypothetical protein